MGGLQASAGQGVEQNGGPVWRAEVGGMGALASPLAAHL